MADYYGYVTTNNGEPIGNNTQVKDGLWFDIVEIKSPEKGEEFPDPSLKDIFQFCFIGHDLVLAGTFVLFDASMRVAGLPDEVKAWFDASSLTRPRYLINMQLKNNPVWHPLGAFEELETAQISFNSWKRYVKPNQTFKIPYQGEEAVLWNRRPGIRIETTIEGWTPFQTVLNRN